MTNKDRYREHCNNKKTIPIFSTDWWLDAVAGKNNWDVALAFHDSEIVASMPYVKKRRFGFKLCTLPQFTPYLGPWIKPSKKKYSKMLGQQKKFFTTLIDQLPKFDYFNQNWSYKQSNWLPFYWKNFSQKSFYTYVIDDLSNLESIWSGFEDNIRWDIGKSKSRYNLIN